jgi:hypothetical protein
MTAKYDKQALKAEYIQGPDELTPRAMAKRDGAAFSAYYVHFRNDNWAEGRADYRRQLQQKTIAAITGATAEKVARIKVLALDAIEAAIMKMALDLQDRKLTDGTIVPGQIVTPNDVSKLIDRLLVLTGNPNTIQENRNIGLSLDRLPPDVARVIADIADERGPERRGLGRATLPGGPPTRNN